MPDVLCLGEILVDWVCTTPGAELSAAESFTKAAGGAPANTAVGLARQGISTGFIGRVSADEFGKWLKQVLSENGVETDLTVEDPESQTRMAYVVTTSDGDRKLAEFSRISCADARLHSDDLKEDGFRSASIIHFGSISLIEEPSRTATKDAIELAKKHGLLISYDPNVRLSLWPSAESCKNTILETLAWADIVKINEDELEFLTGTRDLTQVDKLRKDNDISLFLVTLDSRGAYLSSAHGNAHIPGFQVEIKEATGAGDGFNAGVLAGILSKMNSHANSRKEALKEISLEDLGKIVERGNAIGAIACTRAGAIPALPTLKELEKFSEIHKTAKSI